MGIPLCMCVIVQCLFSYQTLQGSLRVHVCFLTVHVHRASVHTRNVRKHVLEHTRVYEIESILWNVFWFLTLCGGGLHIM